VVVFQPYSWSQIADIVNQRLEAIPGCAPPRAQSAAAPGPATANGDGAESDDTTTLGRKRRRNSLSSEAVAAAAAAITALLPGSSGEPQVRQCIMDARAIELCARRVSAKSGDVRRALELCRKAVLLAAAKYCSHDVPAARNPGERASAGDGTEGDDEDGWEGSAAAAASPPAASSRGGMQLDGASVAADATGADEEDELFAALSMPALALATDAGEEAAAAGGVSGAEGVASPTGRATGSKRKREGNGGREYTSSSAASSTSKRRRMGSSPPPTSPRLRPSALTDTRCACTQGGLAWCKHAPAAAPPAASSGGAPPAQLPPASSAPAPFAPATPAAPAFAVSMADMSAMLAAAYGSRYADVLRALPRQGQVLVCAARALVEREAAKRDAADKAAKFARAVARTGEASLHTGEYEGAAVLLPGASGAGSMGAAGSAAAGGIRDSEFPSLTATAITVSQLQAAYTSLCRRRLLAPVGAAEVADLVDRLQADGIITLGGGGGLGSTRGRAFAGNAASSASWLHAYVGCAVQAALRSIAAAQQVATHRCCHHHAATFNTPLPVPAPHPRCVPRVQHAAHERGHV
jgi:hypothetical protein